MQGTPEFLRFALATGIGAKNSQGLRCCEKIAKKEAEVNLIKIELPGIYSLILPTGLGKTLNSFNVALRLKNLMAYNGRIIFLSIIDQNTSIISEVLEKQIGRKPYSNELLAHHHLSEVFYDMPDKELDDIGADKLLIEGWNSEIIITTFVQFFSTIIGYKNKALKKFNKLKHSIIILDEIQSIPIKYWDAIQKALNEITQELSCYVLFVTATQPAICNAEEVTPLIENNQKKYNLDRTRLIIDIKNKKNIDDVIKIITKQQERDILVIVNTISTADQLYDKCQEHKLKRKYYYLTTKITPKERRIRIKAIKNDVEPKLVISTQLIEAGVDLDFDVVIRDLAPLDSLIQAAGRCNRQAIRPTGNVYVIEMINENKKVFSSFIYDPILLTITREIISKQEIISENQYAKLIEDYFTKIKQKMNTDSIELISAMINLKYDGVENSISDFKLIADDYSKITVFVELDTDAVKLREDYEKIVTSNLSAFEKRDKFDRLKSKFYDYVISISSKIDNKPPNLNNNIYFVPNTNLSNYYDLEKGYKTKSEILIW